MAQGINKRVTIAKESAWGTKASNGSAARNYRRVTASFQGEKDTFGAAEIRTDQQMVDIHMQHDCFVLPTRAEGLGLPYIDSMMIGNPTVGTNYSGNLEFMTNDNSYLIDCQTEPVFNMRHLGGWYTGDMMWAHPSVGNLAQIMKEIYNNQDI